MLERDKFMSPEEAKEFGLIDRVLSSAPSFDDIKKEQDKNDE
jgi:ATP-dependent Clp protease protease subunit